MATVRTLGTVLGGAVAAVLIVAALTIAGVLLINWHGVAAAPVERALGALAQRPVHVAGPVRVELGLRGPVLVLHDMRLANASWGGEPHMMTVRRAEVHLSLWRLLRREARIESVELSDVRASIETDAGGRTNRPDIARDPTTLWPGLRVSGPQSLKARAVTLSYRGGPDLRPLSLQFDESRLTKEEGGHLRIEAQGTFRAAKIAIAAMLGDPGALLEGEASPLEATVVIDNTTVLVKGTLANPEHGPGLALKLDGEGPSVRDLVALLGVDGLPDEGPFTFALDLMLSQTGLAIPDLSASLGSGTVAGTVTARLQDGGGIEAEVVLASDNLDLELLQGDWSKLVDVPKLWSLPIPVDVWRTSLVDITYQAQAVTYRGLTLTDVDSRAFLKDGKLSLYPFAFNLYEVPVEAEMTLDLQRAVPEARIRVDTRRAPLGKALAASEALVGLEGPLDLSVDLTGKGDSLKEIAATLAGTAEARFGPGQAEPALLNTLPSPLRGTWTTWAKGAGTTGGSVPLNCATLALKFAKGRSEPVAFSLVSGQVQFGSDGLLDLASDRLALMVSAEPRPESYLKGLTTGYTVRLDGPIRAPEFTMAMFKPIPVKASKGCALVTASRVPRAGAAANEP